MARVSQDNLFKVNIHAQTGVRHVPFLRRSVRAARIQLKTTLRELSIALVGDRQMSELHQRYMGIAGPTDVLTFELDHEGKHVTAGEIVLCVPEARRRSAESKTPMQHELLLYAIHGMLHLSGFDDRSDAGFRRMHREEDRILTKIGVGPVFARHNRSPRKTGKP